MDYPVYKLRISTDITNKCEVDYVALVDMPAIERDFIAFNAQRQQFEITSEEQRIISGPLMLADKLIFRDSETMGKHYVQFDAPTIKEIAIKFAKKKFQSNVNEMHDPSKQLEGVTLFESFISDSNRGILPMKGYEDSANGSWFGSMFIENEDVWQQVKAGQFKGFSVEGFFIYEKPVLTDEQILNRLTELFQHV